MVATGPLRMTYAAYLAFERDADVRHEFARGEVFAMAGGTFEHARLASAVTTALSLALAGRPCVVAGADARIRISADDKGVYADAFVVCGHREASDDDPEATVNPLVVVEVLSDSTEAYDRGDKFRSYRTLPSLQEYVLVSQRTRRIEVFRRQEEGGWVLHDAGGGEHIRLEALAVELDVDRLYRDPLG